MNMKLRIKEEIGWLPLINNRQQQKSRNMKILKIKRAASTAFALLFTTYFMVIKTNDAFAIDSFRIAWS